MLFARIIIICIVILMVNACATPSPQHGMTNQLLRIRSAIVHAATDTPTWLSAAGALALRHSSLDERVSTWAMRHHYLFGSKENASLASNDLRGLVCAGTAMTLTGMEPTNKFQSSRTSQTSLMGVNLKSYATNATALAVNSLTIGWLKQSLDRMWPNGENAESMPSSHSAQALSCAALASRNLTHMPIAAETKSAMRVTLYTLAGATAWARIEGGHHYPSDTLAGFAVANFLTGFIYEMFLSAGDESSGQGSTTSDLAVEISDKALWIKMYWDF